MKLAIFRIPQGEYLAHRLPPYCDALIRDNAMYRLFRLRFGPLADDAAVKKKLVWLAGVFYFLQRKIATFSAVGW